MDDKQSAKLRAYLNVKEVIKRYPDAWKGLTAFSKSYNAFIGNLDRINTLNEQLQRSTRGTTESKMVLKEHMAHDTLLLIGALKAYASVNDDVLLARDIELSLSLILAAKDTDADDICLHAVNKAKALLADLADYGITQADIDLAQASIGKFADTIGKPKSTITEIKSINEQITALFKEIDKILDEQLDNLILRIRTTFPNFYSEYFSARRVGGGDSSKKDGGGDVKV